MRTSKVDPDAGQKPRSGLADRAVRVSRVAAADLHEPFPTWAVDFLSPMVDAWFWGRDKLVGTRPVNVKVRVDSYVNGDPRGLSLLDDAEIERNYGRCRRGHKGDRIFYTTRPNAPVALVRIDIDAHGMEGDPRRDDAAAADFVANRIFTGLYAERSSGCGHAVYLLLNTRRRTVADVNAALARLELTLRAAFAQQNFRSVVEVQGRITPVEGRTVGTYAQLAAFPILRAELPDLFKLAESPRVSIADLDALADNLGVSPVVVIVQQPESRAITRPSGSRVRMTTRTRHSRPAVPSTEGGGRQDDCVSVETEAPENAHRRMCETARDFDRRCGRPANVNELMAHYEVVNPGVDAAHPARWRRAEHVVATYRPCQRKNSFAQWKPGLLAAVKTFCPPDSCTEKYPYVVDELSLVAVLYLVTWWAFAKAPHPRRQWTLSQRAFMVALKSLVADEPDLRCGNQNKMTAARVILWRAGLIACLDDTYLPAGPETGLAKKWVLGPNHPRYAECLKWAEDNNVDWQPACTRPHRQLAEVA